MRAARFGDERALEVERGVLGGREAPGMTEVPRREPGDMAEQRLLVGGEGRTAVPGEGDRPEGLLGVNGEGDGEAVGGGGGGTALGGGSRFRVGGTAAWGAGFPRQVDRRGGVQMAGGEGREFPAGGRLVERRADLSDRPLHGPHPGHQGLVPLRHDTSTAERFPGGVPGHPHCTSGWRPAHGTELVRDGCATVPDLIKYSRGYSPVDASFPGGPP